MSKEVWHEIERQFGKVYPADGGNARYLDELRAERDSLKEQIAQHRVLLAEIISLLQASDILRLRISRFLDG